MAYQTILVQSVWKNTNLVKHFVLFLASKFFFYKLLNLLRDLILHCYGQDCL
jgi:hypothetical protein